MATGFILTLGCRAACGSIDSPFNARGRCAAFHESPRIAAPVDLVYINYALKRDPPQRATNRCRPISKHLVRMSGIYAPRDPAFVPPNFDEGKNIDGVYVRSKPMSVFFRSYH